MVVTPPRSAREAQGAPQGERAWYEESGPRAEIGWPRSFAARGRDGVGREDKSSKRRAGPNGPVPGSDESPSRGGHGGMPYARDEPDARRGSPAHARSGSQPGLGNHCGGGSTGGKPRGLTPLCAPGWGAPSRAVRGIPPLLVSVPIFRPRHKRGSTYKDATHAIPWKGCRHRRSSRRWPPRALLPKSPIQRIRFDRGYEPSTTSSRQWDPAAAKALPIWASSRWPWASTKKV